MEKNLDILSQPLERMQNELQKNPKNPFYFCTLCDMKTDNKKDYTRHLFTAKHNKREKMMTNDATSYSQIIITTQLFECICGNKYKFRQGLFKHKLICKNIKNPLDDNQSEKFLIKQLMIQNQQLLFDNKEFKELIIDQSSKMMELATKASTINNNNNSNTNCHNKQFNLQVFLNEKCKNAMNMTDFVSSLEIVSDDLEDIGKLGYVQGISNIFMKGLKGLDESERPIHCTDKKRETLYIKNSDVWDKDDNREKMNLVIKELAHKNFKYIPIWTDANPSYNDGTTKKNDQYMRNVNQVMTCISPDDETGFNKIIKNIANEVCVDKEALMVL